MNVKTKTNNLNKWFRQRVW